MRLRSKTLLALAAIVAVFCVASTTKYTAGIATIGLLLTGIVIIATSKARRWHS